MITFVYNWTHFYIDLVSFFYTGWGESPMLRGEMSWGEVSGGRCPGEMSYTRDPKKSWLHFIRCSKLCPCTLTDGRNEIAFSIDQHHRRHDNATHVNGGTDFCLYPHWHGPRNKRPPDKRPQDSRPLRQKATGQKATERNVKMLLSCQDVLERLWVVLKTVEQIVLSSVLVCRSSPFVVYLSPVLVNCSTTATVCIGQVSPC